MKIAYVASFPPRECGIATFTQNLMQSISVSEPLDDASFDPVVIAINDTGQVYPYPCRVGFVISQDNREDYEAAANYINLSGAQVCILQHEFGIFGGESGLYVLSLLHHLKIPFVCTFHTVLKEPSFLQKAILQEIARMAAGVIVMSQKAVVFLDNIYEIPSDKIHLIEHGVPELTGEKLLPEEDLLQPYKGRRILFTFGLLNRNKGIETVIKALPAIVARHPEVIYLVLGNTHPGVVRSSGEEYRGHLQQLIDTLGMKDHVRFINRFVTESQLAYYLKTIDIYITPYLNEAQITSGTLSYAVGAGAAVLSTPYWHAQELLADGRGQLFDFKDSEGLGEKINALLSTPDKMEALRTKALEFGVKMKWPRIGKRYLHMLHHVLEGNAPSPVSVQVVSAMATELPPFSLAHIFRLTDSTGILQHAKYGIPNLKEGYCIDDNSRALVLALMAFRRHKSAEILRLLPIYLSFVHYMQRPDGFFRNFLTFKREFTEDIGSEDAFGRTIWALGTLIRYAPNSAYREMGHEIFHRAAPHFTTLKHLRGIANTMIGLSHYLSFYPADEGLLDCMGVLARKLTDAYEKENREDWHWFEEKMIYDNGILPLALLMAYGINGDPRLKKIGLESIQFLEKVCFQHEWFNPVGNKGWYQRGGDFPRFDQQALETMAMVLMYHEAYRISGKESWLDKMYRCHNWFLGENELHIPLFDQETCGCCDGLQEDGLNRNQGAESTLAYWISHLTILKAMEIGTTYWQKTIAPKKEVLL